MLKLERAREQTTLSRCEERLKFTIKQLLEHRTDMKVSYCFDCGMPWKCYACGADFVAMTGLESQADFVRLENPPDCRKRKRSHCGSRHCSGRFPSSNPICESTAFRVICDKCASESSNDNPGTGCAELNLE